MQKLIALLLFFTWLSSCTQKKGASGEASSPDADSLAQDIRVLSSDSFQGRKPFTEGEIKTINYLQAQFRAIGVEPGNGNSFFQEVPMVNIATEPDSLMHISSAKQNITLKGFEDYIIWTEKTDSAIALDNEVVFAGYGVVAPEHNWNDYAGLDVKGKIVLLLVNDPGYGIDSTLFKGDTMTYYGRWTYKFEEAARQGAKGCLIVHDTKAASYPFSVVQNNWKGSRLRLDDRNKPNNYCAAVGWISRPATIQLLNAAGFDSTLLRKASTRGFKAVPLPVKLATNIKAIATYSKSHNVIAKVTGSKYPDEYIIYTAHWDHLGIGKPDETGDSVYNGAIDNATGTAGLLQLARMFRREKPERTIVFLAVTAEEQGLWGSAYYAYNPVYPLSKTLANINMDGLNVIGKTNDITLVGQSQSDLENILADEVKKLNRFVALDKNPHAGHYYRSDHFNFAKVGVPALYAGSGLEVIGKNKDFGVEWKKAYGAKDYHHPSDEYDESNWRFDGALEDLQLIYSVGKRISSAAKWPEWNKDSEFRKEREKSLSKK
ncbi:MAG TPA: M28 family metallopeptidase [Chitinophagaceae bacterium]|nr:M28 family metallopeptidase [Chitinophagaceae bacterium]